MERTRGEKIDVCSSINAPKLQRKNALGSDFYSELPSKKAERFEKLLDFARSHSIVTRGSVSLSCATTPHPSVFLNLNGIKTSNFIPMVNRLLG